MKKEQINNVEIKNRKDLRRFVNFTFTLNSQNPHWTPPIIEEEIDTLAQTKTPVFKNAKFWCSKSHWVWASISPNPREKASFLEENLLPLKDSGQLNLFYSAEDGFCSELGFDLLLVNGHTEKMSLPKIQYKGKTILFASDLVPTAGHIPIPYLMGYDVRPLITMEEKTRILNNLVENNSLIFLQHDPVNEVVFLKKTEKGVRLDRSSTLKDLF